MYDQEERPAEEKVEKAERIPTFFRFEDLRVYHKSLDYLVWLQDISMLFPENEKSQLAARFNDAARNISFYIAEGSARNKVQFIHYLKMAKSSIRECLVFTTLSFRSNYISDTYEDISRNYLMEMTKMIGALISSLQRSAGFNNNNNYNNNRYTENQNSHYGNYVSEGNAENEARGNY
ncbi:MAG: four helix bundle protein [Bacteroidales bacterium]|nr:four helix bundle protein [Bacteroidales bacterium]MCF6341951.1 four helix bundle protein [Bacteroidales bacterium]